MIRNSPLPCCLLALCLCTRAFSQDILLTRDSLKKEVIVREIGEGVVKYKLYKNPDGPLYSDAISDLASITYKNGEMLVFVSPVQPSATPPTPEEKKKTLSAKTADWVKISVELGLASGQSFALIPIGLNQELDTKFAQDQYSANSGSSKTYYSPMPGVNFILGKNRVVRHLAGISFMQVKSNYDHDIGGFDPNSLTGDYSHATVSGTYSLLMLSSGADFRLFRGFSMSAIIGFGYGIRSTEITNGYSYHTQTTIVTNTVTMQETSATKYDTTSISNNRVSHPPGYGALCVQFRMSYDFKIRERIFGIYALYNLPLSYRLTYWSAGISWYPFKKFRPENL